MVDHLPLEDALVHLAGRDEMLIILAEQAVTYCKQVVVVAVVVGLPTHVGIVVQPHAAHVVTDHNNRLAEHFSNLGDLVVRVVELAHTLEPLVVA